MLDQIIPFRYLSGEQRQALRADLSEHSFRADEILIRQGDLEDRLVFLLEEGSVQIIDRVRDPPRAVRTVTAGHYFGERAALFEEPRSVEVCAVESVRALSMTGERFLRLMRESTAFAQALGSILRDKQGIFTPFDRFRVELLRAVGHGAVDLARLLPLYRDLAPALHPHANSPDVVDVAALNYAVRRLPSNLTRTLSYYLTQSLPRLYADPDARFEAVPTVARRRAVYEMMPGKNMVLIRDGVSDLADLITCLCLYAIEARKIRRRLRDRGGLDRIDGAELGPLRAVWPEDTAARVMDIALHHEDFRIEVHKELDNYNSAQAETWCMQIAEATRELMGHDPTELPPTPPRGVADESGETLPRNESARWIGALRGELG